MTEVEGLEENLQNKQEVDSIREQESDSILSSNNRNVEGLEFISEQDGYCYYEDPVSKKQYSVDSDGFWYLWDEEKNVYIHIEGFLCEGSEHAVSNDVVASASVKSKIKRREVVGIKFNEENGYPIFPTNDKGVYVLPKDEHDQPFFPLDEFGHPVFPYDFEKKKWTFPLDDTDEPIFPRNPFNKPLVPVDDNGYPIFPVDEKGNFIFPLDETNCPIPALTPDGRSVIPIDEFGNNVIPRDREGTPLIQFANDGVTPMSLTEYKQWKQYFRANTKKYYEDLQQQQQQQHHQVSPYAPLPIGVMFHPLNLEHNAMLKVNDITMLQRTKRVRPEDIDLPIMADSGNSLDYQYYSQDTVFGNGNLVNGITIENYANTEENAKALKRKKFLSAQLNFSKKLPPKVSQKGNKSKEESVDLSDSNDKKLVDDSKMNDKEYQENKQKAEYKNEEIAIRLNCDEQDHVLKKLNYVDDRTQKLKNGSHNNDSEDNCKREKSSAKKHHKNSKKSHRHRSRSTDRYSDSDSSDSKHRNSKSKKHERRKHSLEDENDQKRSSQYHDSEASEVDAYHDAKRHKSERFDVESKQTETVLTDEKKDDLQNKVQKLYSYSQNNGNGEEKKIRDDDDMDIDSDETTETYSKRRDEYDNGQHQDSDQSRKSKHSECKKKDPEVGDLSNFVISQLNEHSDLSLVKRLIKNSRRKYDDIKKQIVRLEKERSREKDKLKKLFEVESQVEERLGFEFLPSSDND